LKFEYLNEVENMGNFKSNAFSRDSGRERHLLQRFAILMGEEGGNRPLGEREAVERRKGSVAVKIEERTF
jgi:hypothetical protein